MAKLRLRSWSRPTKEVQQLDEYEEKHGPAGIAADLRQSRAALA